MTAGIVIIGVIAAGTYMTYAPDGTPDEGTLNAVVPPGASAPAATDQPAPDDTVAAAEEAPAQPETAPSIDEVRLEDDGLAVIAGRAEPGAEVSVLVDGEEVATATADDGGSFAAVGSVPPGEGARVVTLEATGSGEPVASAEDVILAPVTPQAEAVAVAPTGNETADPPSAEKADAPASEAATVAEAAPQGSEEQDVAALPAEEPAVPAVPQPAPGDDTLAEPQPSPAPQVAAEATQPGAEPSAPAATPAPATGSQSVTVLKSTADGVELLQPAPETMSQVAIDTIGYSDTGEVQLSGRAVPGTSEVRIYLDNRFAGALIVDGEGGWRGELPEVATGIYQLRVDEVNEAGDVTSRIETPFKREAPAVLAEATEGRDGPVTAVTVQTGDTLWAIARDRYGEGVLYVRVFEANRTDIRDPDLIYPGQVFDLPVE